MTQTARPERPPLRRFPNGTRWFTYLPTPLGAHELGVRLVAAGDAQGPSVPHETALWALADRFEELTRAVEAYLAALPLDTPVPLEGNESWKFAAESCGFREGWFRYQTLWVCEEQPSTASLTLYTGQPDGYANFEITLEEGRPIQVSAFCS